MKILLITDFRLPQLYNKLFLYALSIFVSSKHIKKFSLQSFYFTYKSINLDFYKL